MKRDLNLIRNILLETEAAPSDTLTVYAIADKYHVDPDLVAYQLDLLAEAGFLKVRGLTIAWTPDTRKYDDERINRLTLEGHNYLDAIRNDTVWQNTLAELRNIGISVSFEIVKEIASNYLKRMLGL
ncbi:hypothetical protein CJ260_03910 [Megasphaera sp. ASD88]|uniref:DUF2513 domain-containing protein n=1 Tax=Megasphaera sp. ASD88 TaxID=2027407 RepID=UPI000BABDED8|nr:DUF2513 domain-containing protein [Megasphaera sp. ASD88]MDN0047534.1 DUF2513 domain-containing protein [Megasphaera hexanoica]PAV39618.1 hypothetical protein CJ260_03910 [Megasphaera sp. ASD88]